MESVDPGTGRDGVELDLVLEWSGEQLMLELRQADLPRVPTSDISWRVLSRESTTQRRFAELRSVQRWAAHARENAARLSLDLLHRNERGMAEAVATCLRISHPGRPLVVYRIQDKSNAPVVPQGWPLSWPQLRLIDPVIPFELTLRDVLSGPRPRLIVLQLPPESSEPTLLEQLGGELVPVPRWAVLGRVAELARIGCPAIMVVDTGVAIYDELASDQPLDQVARRLESKCTCLALRDRAENIVSVRRALIDAPPRSFDARIPTQLSLRQLATIQNPAPRTELEELLHDRLRDTQIELSAQLGELTRIELAWNAESLARAAERIARQLARADLALAWALALGASDEPHFGDSDGELPARHLGVQVLDGDRADVTAGLAVGMRYVLDVSIAAPEISTLSIGGITCRLPDLADLFEASTLDLDVVLFALANEFSIERPRARLQLQRLGGSDHAELALTPLPGGVRRRLRIGLYHRTHLIQSMAIDVSVAGGVDQLPPPSLALDYLASEQLLTVDLGEAPTLSLWLNSTPQGSHLLGIIGEDEPPITVVIADSRDAARLRRVLDTFPHDADSCSPDTLQHAWVALARAGHTAFASLFTFSSNSSAFDRLIGRLRTNNAALIEIARCAADAPGIPWQLIYDAAIERTAKICPVYLERTQGTSFEPSCRSDLRCTHRDAFIPASTPTMDDASRATLCPFRFWGLRHRIAQPAGIIDGVSDEASNCSGRRACEGEPRIVIPYFKFDNAEDHVDRIVEIGGARQVEVWSNSTLSTVRDVLRERHAILYFYCHGEVEPTEGTFGLIIGSEECREDPISASELLSMVPSPRWRHAPIVVLNGCDTLRIAPDDGEIHRLLDMLRKLGAGAIIGTEVVMMTDVAAQAGEHLITGMLDGRPLEDVVLGMRRALLGAGTARGLAYNVYAQPGFAYPKRSRG